MTIAIAGATGTLGSFLAQRLVARGERVRVLTRDAARARHLTGIDVCIGDVRDPSTLDAFASGATTIISAVHGFAGPGGVSPASIDRDGNRHLVDAAVRAGADVVMVSVVGSAPDHPMDLMRMKYLAEEHLKASGAKWTIVRATAFLETWVRVMTETASRKHGPLVFGRGANPINFVSARDVAALVENVVLDPATRGATLELGGPEDFTMTQFAQAVQNARGMLPPKHLPRAMLRVASIVMTPLRPAFARKCRAALAMDMDARFAGPGSRSKTTLHDVLSGA